MIVIKGKVLGVSTRKYTTKEGNDRLSSEIDLYDRGFVTRVSCDPECVGTLKEGDLAVLPVRQYARSSRSGHPFISNVLDPELLEEVNEWETGDKKKK